MDTIQVKVLLLKRGLKIAEMAAELCEDERSVDAVRVMLSQMINGRRFYPTLAGKVKERYGISLRRPAIQQRHRAA